MQVLNWDKQTQKKIRRDYATCFDTAIFKKVSRILSEVRQSGDTALRRYTREFDGIERRVHGCNIAEMRARRRDDIRETGVARPNGSDFYDAVITIPYLVGSTVTGIRQKELSAKYKQPVGWKQRLFNADVLRTHTGEVLLTEGEFDAMLAHQMGHAAIGCPGANQWQDSWAELFEDVRRVWIVFDNDDSGRSGAEKVKESLGAKARIATVPAGPTGALDDHNDLTDWIVDQGHSKDDLTHHLRQSRGGILISVDEAFKEYEELQGLQGLQFNDPELDRLIHPGLLASQVCVVMAKTGQGKTVSLLNIFHRMSMVQPELKVLFVSLEQTRGEWADRAMRIFGYYNLHLAPTNDSPDELERATQELRHATRDYWVNRLQIVDRNRISEEELLEAIDEYEEIMGGKPDLVAVDYVGYLARGFKGKDDYERTSEAIMTLKAVAKEKRVAMIAPSQVNRGANFGSEPAVDAARNSGVVEETADFAFTLWSEDGAKGKDPEARTGVVYMRIGKSRHGGAGHLLQFRFAPQTLVLVPKSTPEAVMALHELKWPIEKRYGWQKALYRHRTGQASW